MLLLPFDRTDEAKPDGYARDEFNISGRSDSDNLRSDLQIMHTVAKS
jgi:hypothetical protein